MSDPDRHAPYFERLARAVLESPGTLDPQTRSDIAAGGGPPELQPYLEKVRRHAYRVTDEEVEELGRAGWSEDAILEATLAAALGAARLRLRAGLEALGA